MINYRQYDNKKEFSMMDIKLSLEEQVKEVLKIFEEGFLVILKLVRLRD